MKQENVFVLSGKQKRYFFLEKKRGKIEGFYSVLELYFCIRSLRD